MPSNCDRSNSGTLFNHYSLLATAEQLLGLSRLGQAATATTMTKAFNLLPADPVTGDHGQER